MREKNRNQKPRLGDRARTERATAPLEVNKCCGMVGFHRAGCRAVRDPAGRDPGCAVPGCPGQCKAWTCGLGPGCGHGHHHNAAARDAAANEHQAAHALEAGHVGPPPDDPSGRGNGLTEGGLAPVVSMEHHAPEACPRCRLLRDSGFPELADAAAKGGRP